MLRLLRQHTGDIVWVIKLNAQYGSMVRTSLSVHARLKRVQAVRQKREAIDGAANADAWALHPADEPPKAALPKAAPVQAPAACVDQKIAENVSENGIKSHDAAFETALSAQPLNQASNGQGSKRSGETAPREATALLSRLNGRQQPANQRETTSRAA